MVTGEQLGGRGVPSANIGYFVLIFAGAVVHHIAERIDRSRGFGRGVGVMAEMPREHDIRIFV